MRSYLVFIFCIFPLCCLFASEPQEDLAGKLKSLQEIIEQEKIQIRSLKDELLKLKEENESLQIKLKTPCPEKIVYKVPPDYEKQIKKFFYEAKDAALDREKRLLVNQFQARLRQEKELIEELKKIAGKIKKEPAKIKKKKIAYKPLSECKKEVQALLSEAKEKDNQLKYLKDVIDETIKRIESLSAKSAFNPR